MLTLCPGLPFGIKAEVAPAPTVPRGVFALIKSGAATRSSVLSSPDVDGISLRIGWDAVNPSEDRYDWSYFDTEIAKAKKAGKKALLRVSAGQNIPSWVAAASKAAGEPTFSFYEPDQQGSQLITEPVFWAPTLLAKKAKFIAAFGARYNSNPVVAIVTCQFAGARNDDNNVPDSTAVDGIPPSGSSEVSRWLAAGYTSAKMVDAGNKVISDTMTAFSNKAVALAIGSTSTELDPQGADYVAQMVINTARSKWGNRMVATRNNISEKAPPLPLPTGSGWSLMYDLRPAVGGQMLWFSCGDSTCRNAAKGAPCDAATVLMYSVERAHDYGWNYLEIYTADIEGLPSVIHYAHTLLTQSSPSPTNSTLEPPTNLHGKELDISTRLQVGTGQQVGIAGVIVSGTTHKEVIVRALGPTLAQFGVPGVLQNPALDLYDSSNNLIASNDNWKSSQQTAIQSSGYAPGDDRESAIIQTLPPGNYTVVVRGVNATIGIALLEVHYLDQSSTSLITNLSTRGLVGTNANVMIGGFIVGSGLGANGDGSSKVLVRGLGPELTNFGVMNALQDPILELHDGNGNLLITNDNWKESQQAAIQATGLAPGDDRESAILTTLIQGNWTAIMRGKNNTTGVGLIEVYRIM